MMLKLQHLLVVVLVATTVSAASVPISAAAGADVPAAKSVKREVGDARLSSPFTSFPLGVTETLGTGALTNLAYPGSLGNVYAHDDELYGAPGYYEYPQYAAGYGNYRNYGFYDDFDGSALGLSPFSYGLRGGLGLGGLGLGIGPLSGYPYSNPYYQRSGLLGRPAAFYGRLGNYYYD